ncbi:MAG TPA: phage tail tube protein [Nitrospira sp.]|nr:phage tail tube protein [Nitrospira sp.]
MTCISNKIDSNVTGLRFTEEECIGILRTVGSVLPPPVWYTQEPNSYNNFGAKVTTVARNPINPSRQRKKGTVTDLASAGGYTQDCTAGNLVRLFQGFCFANARQKASVQPLNGTQNSVSGVTAAAKTYTVSAGGAAFISGRLVFATNFTNAGNNGLKSVASSTATTVVVNETTVDEAAPPANANLQVVGHQFAAGDLAVTMNAGSVYLNCTAADFTAMGFVVGEWIFIGGDVANSAFASFSGFARIGTIAAKQLLLDKIGWSAPAADPGTGKTVRLFYGTVIRNEDDPTLIVRKSYQLERSLGSDANGPQYEYVVGAVPNEFTLTLKQAEKVTMDFTYVGTGYETNNGTIGPKAGTRPSSVIEDAFNTSSDFARIRMSQVVPGNPSPTPLFAFATDMTLTIKNNVNANKAIGILGAMDVSAGTFEVGGASTVYFATVDAAAAVRNNADVTLDIIMVKKNAGLLFDIPLLTLGNGEATVAQDQPIMLALDTNAAQSTFGNTLLFMHFPYLPNLA